MRARAGRHDHAVSAVPQPEAPGEGAGLARAGCPHCGIARGSVLVGADEVARLTDLHRRIQARASRGERARWKEKLDYVHGYAADVRRCEACGTLYRDPRLTAEVSRQRYEADGYGRPTLDMLRGLYLPVYRRAVRSFGERLPRGSRVLEVGSYAGAFLEAAREVGWRPEGVDVGCDVVRYARDRGLTVHRGDVRDVPLEAGAYDAAFVWNCFEQVPDTGSFVRRLWELVRPGGLLVVRTPNARFCAAAAERLRRPGKGPGRRLTAEYLAYAGLLTFPFAVAYPPETLARVLGDGGFEGVEVGAAHSLLLRDPTYRMRARARALLGRLLVERGLAAAAGPPWLRAAATRGPAP